MHLIFEKPYTSAKRFQIKQSYTHLFKNTNLIKLLKQKNFKCNSSGRSTNTGHITTHQRGGGVVHIYKKINFKNLKSFIVIIGTLHNPYSNNFICLAFDLLRKKFLYTPSAEYAYPGSLLLCQKFLSFNFLTLGSRFQLKELPPGTTISQLSNFGGYSTYIRSAGTNGILLNLLKNKAIIKLPSTKIILLPKIYFATVGSNANKLNNKIRLGKAGQNRWRGIRPTVRGVAMNPVDHPHGGRTRGGFHAKTPWGKPTLGKKTAKNNK